MQDLSDDQMADPSQEAMRRHIIRAGITLFGGARWQAELGRALDINERRFRRMMKGEEPCPDLKDDLIGIVDRYHAAVLKHAAALAEELRRLRS
jgi:hypothetical protein